MLNEIVSYVAQFAEVIATVTGIDVEVVDADLTRIAGTGALAAGVGRNMQSAGELYCHALKNREPLFVDNPKDNPICSQCQDREQCREKLTLCAPIVVGGEIVGVIGLLCYSDADRGRIVGNREIYLYFVKQIADAIARLAQREQVAQETRLRLDMLLKITASQYKHVLVLDADGEVSFVNAAARNELGIYHPERDWLVNCVSTGNAYSDMEEFEVTVRSRNGSNAATGKKHVVFGSFIPLELNDSEFHEALVFEPKRRIAEMVSHFGGASDNAEVLHFIIGNSEAMRSLKQNVLRIAATSSTVLITGESGTGKEMFARAIHAASKRKDKPFVAINCGAIPDALLESELFGYVRGAFTDASPTGRIGKFELADQGVIFLDEISSMPLYLQVKLLRILQERSFNRLGSNKPVDVDLRVIAATNENLQTLIAQKRFREDLYYRLSVIPFDIPPLRERREDIPVLAEYFLERYCRLYAKTPASLSKQALDKLYAYDWPGNIRELENCIEYMVNMNEGQCMPSDVLPAAIREKNCRGCKTGTSHAQEPLSAIGVTAEEMLPMAVYEEEIIRKAVSLYGNTTEGKRRAAEVLGISLATLYRKVGRK